MRPARRSADGDLHGNAPDDCPVAQLIIDAIHDFDARDHFVLKLKYSGFYSTNLLLDHPARTLILTGCSPEWEY